MFIHSIEVYRLSIPMEPFTISSGTLHFAQNTYLRIHTDTGLTGVGECSAFPMIAGETQDTCFVLARDFARIWKGKDPMEIDARMAELHAYIYGNNTIKSAFDMALFDLAAKEKNMPLYQFLGGSYMEPESDITVGVDTPEKMAHRAKELVNHRHVRYLKIKVGKDPEEDIQRIIKIRQAIGPDVAMRLDANAGWDYEAAVMVTTSVESLNIQFCEQPMARRLDEKMPSLRRLSNIPIMADESVFDHHDAQRLIKAKACDYVNIKLSKSGGLLEAKKIHDVCQKGGVPNMIGGMLESRLALSAKVHFAMASPNVQFYDLDTCLLGHKEDPVVGGVVFDNMRLVTPPGIGIGADINSNWLKGAEHFVV